METTAEILIRNSTACCLGSWTASNLHEVEKILPTPDWPDHAIQFDLVQLDVLDTPAKMIASMIEARLDSTRMFGAVLSGSSEVKADLRLDSEVTGLLQDFTDGDSKVILKIKVNLIDVSDRSLLSSRSFSYAETSNGANPEAGVAAANHAAERFLIDLVKFIAESVEHIDCSGFD